jgi:NAD(P)-dependent dehydrogenase (short-subunit alcohol dehydrogenase family)
MAKVVLVTGGGHGIGRAIAQRQQREGWQVVVADKAPAALDFPARFVQADIADPAQLEALVAGIAAAEGRLDAVVSNAGFGIWKKLAELSLAEWQTVLATNLTALFLLAKHAEPMLRGAKGSILAIASTRAHQSEPNSEAYAATKGGLVALTHALAISLGPDVRANCISPGWIDVKGEALRPEDHAQHPAGRVGRPEDIAGMAAWLLGPESGFVTGQEFIADGGMSRKMIYVE